MKPWHYRVRWDEGHACWLVEWRPQGKPEKSYRWMADFDWWCVAIAFAIEAARTD